MHQRKSCRRKNGDLTPAAGIALAFLRLNYQAQLLSDANAPSPDYLQYALDRIPKGFPTAPLIPSRLSTSSLSPVPGVVLRIFAAVAQTHWGVDSKPSISEEDINCLEEATQISLKNGHLVHHNGNNMGGDELLFGRAGLLWALLNVRAHQYDDKTQKALVPLLQLIPKLIDTIVDAGREGSRLFTEKNGEENAHPLMYAWMEGHYAFGT